MATKYAAVKTAKELHKHCPAYLGSYPAEPSISDLYFATQDQIDLYDQGEESDIQNGRQRRSWLAFATHCKALK
jgi:hypothetical protein